eukprot:5151879-Pyramimonas_sp.AAC.1
MRLCHLASASAARAPSAAPRRTWPARSARPRPGCGLRAPRRLHQDAPRALRPVEEPPWRRPQRCCHQPRRRPRGSPRLASSSS